MIRNRLVATVLLALGTSAIAVLAAEPPLALIPKPDEAKPTEQPPERIIKVEIGFEPGPLEDPVASAPSPVQSAEPPTAPNSPAPSPVPAPPVGASSVPVAPMPAPIGTPDASMPTPLTLAALERFALGRYRTQAQPPAGHAHIALAVHYSDQQSTVADNADLPHGFVDKVVPATAGTQGKPAAPEMLAQQYHLINSVRLRYYHLLALQKLVAVREDLAGISRDAVSAIDAMTASGQATKAELLQARVEAREQLAALQYARSVHATVWHRMAATIGQPELPLGPLAGDIEQCCAVPKFEAAWAHVLDANPDLLVARGEVAHRQATLRQSLTRSGMKANQEKTAPDGLIGQAAAWFNGPAATHEPQVKQAAWTELSRCEVEVGRLEQSLKQRLADAYVRHDRAKEVTDLYHSQNLPDAKEAFELSVIGYRQGRGSWPQVQIAQRNYFRMSTEYVEALAELRRSELVILGLLMDGPEESPAQK
jgi:hypothetical protein